MNGLWVSSYSTNNIAEINWANHSSFFFFSHSYVQSVKNIQFDRRFWLKRSYAISLYNYTLGQFLSTSSLHSTYLLLNKVSLKHNSKNTFFIKFEFHRVSNCRVRTCVKIKFCSNISSSGSSITSFSGFWAQV